MNLFSVFNVALIRSLLIIYIIKIMNDRQNLNETNILLTIYSIISRHILHPPITIFY